MSAQLCAVDECGRTAALKGWCEKHYRRWKRHGDPTKTLSPTRVYGSVEERFWAKTLPPNSEGCMLWDAALDHQGYGSFKGAGRQGGAHRFAYEFVIGPIPDGMQLDHACHTADISCPGGTECQHRRCVTPQHLEPVTKAENTRRSQPWNVNKAKTHCKYGHEYTPENTGYSRGRHGMQRRCRACDRDRGREKRRKKDV